MRLARQGDDEAYRRLLGQVAVWLRVVVRRGLASAGRGPADCEDIVQEALLAMHLKRDTWDEARPIEPWLRAIARHKLADYLRRRGFHDHVDIDDYADAPELAVDVDAARPWTRGGCSRACRSASGGSCRRFPSRDTAPPTSPRGWA